MRFITLNFCIRKNGNIDMNKSSSSVERSIWKRIWRRVHLTCHKNRRIHAGSEFWLLSSAVLILFVTFVATLRSVDVNADPNARINLIFLSFLLTSSAIGVSKHINQVKWCIGLAVAGTILWCLTVFWGGSGQWQNFADLLR